MDIRGIIFDRDGTILDITGTFYHFILWKAYVVGIHLPNREMVLKNLYNEQFWIELSGGDFTFRSIVNEHFYDIPKRFLQYSTPYPGLKNSLQILYDNGVKMILTSSWSATEKTKEILQKHKMLDFFRNIFTADDVPKITSIYDTKLELMSKSLGILGTHPKETVVVGDTYQDVQVGKELGVNTIGVLTGSSLFRKKFQELKPDLIIDSAAFLPKVMGLL
jgi:phosphoglycolate phosphatase